MAIIKRETTVKASADSVWISLIDDPNRWGEWLTPIRGVEERVEEPVREGLEFHVQLGKLSAKVKVTEAVPGSRLRWKAGPGMMMAMGMSMRGTLEFQPVNGATHVFLRMVTPMMMGPMMRMMSGLNPKEEMTKTIERIRVLSNT
ncbi:MAG: SRPBCC family protein [Dehalococcoidia bacterium]